MPFAPKTANKPAAKTEKKVYKESDGVAYFSTTKDGKRDYINVKMKDGAQLYLNPSKGVKVTIDNSGKSKDTNPDFSVSIKARS